MTVTQTSTPVIAQPGQQIALSSLLEPGLGLPSTIGVAIWDDNNYTNSNPGTLGYLSGNGAQTTVSVQNPSTGQDYSYVLFTYDAGKGEYYNSTLGYLNDIIYVAPTGAAHAELLTLFSFKNGTSLTSGNLTDLGDVSVVVPPSKFVNPLTGASIGQATPNGICAIAQTFIGQDWNDAGCALLVQEISALAGATTPFTAVAGVSGLQSPSNNEWYVVYDGSKQANPTVAGGEALARAGDIVGVTWPNGTGHVFVVVSGSGGSAMTIDNQSDTLARDGSPNDIVISAPHTAVSALYAGGEPIPSSIYILRLDTPILSAQATAPTVNTAGRIELASLITASDPTGKAITEYQIYDSASGSSLTVNGTPAAAHSATDAITVGSLSAISLSNGDDVVEVRGFNGSYWGDWQSVTVAPATGSKVVDSADNVAGSLDSLAGLAAKGTISSITLTDGGIPGLTVTASQFSADSAALNEIASAHTVTVQMSGTAAAHNFAGENWTGASALQFADQTVIVAATPGPASAVTTGNVTELYSAVLAREPDAGGLAFYQNYLKTNPNAPLLQFAEWFLSSTEYTGAHNYAQTTAGDTQFITDSYQNLLHRAPQQSEIDFYLNNVLEKPGTQLQNHAQMLVYFSASTEFLSDVQITASNPASTQHWLLLT